MWATAGGNYRQIGPICLIGRNLHTLCLACLLFLSDLSILPLSRGMDAIRWGRHPILAEDLGDLAFRISQRLEILGTSGKTDASEEWRTISLVGK